MLEGHVSEGIVALVRHAGSRVIDVEESLAVLPLMSFSRSNTMNAYPRCGFFFLFGFSSAWPSLTMRI